VPRTLYLKVLVRDVQPVETDEARWFIPILVRASARLPHMKSLKLCPLISSKTIPPPVMATSSDRPDALMLILLSVDPQVQPGLSMPSRLTSAAWE
jgi:hypothetical protein